MTEALLQLTEALSQLNAIVWGVPMMFMLFGTGLYLNIRLRVLPMRRIGYAFRMLLQKPGDSDKGDIAPFKALMTSMSATVGTGNIAGVATAIGIGGPGALFWMWVTALIGLATKYSETVLAVNFREQHEDGRTLGGPMYFIRNGLGAKWSWLATAYALFAGLAGFGLGNTVQSNSMAQALNNNFDVPETVTAVVLLILISMVLLGGIKRISTVASALVPTMAVAYFLSALVVIVVNIDAVPAVFSLVLESAFTGTAATGGFAGAAVWVAIQMGVARGIFSNEAGLGSGSIAHAAAQTSSPVRQGFISMLGTFTDTIIICSLTGFVLLLTGVWQGEARAAAMTTEAFSTIFPYGGEMVTVALVLFAFTTILGWSYYGERSVEYLFGKKAIIPFRVVWILAVPVGAMAKLDLVWLVADTLNALMAIPNLIALVLLSPVVVKLTKEYLKRKESV